MAEKSKCDLPYGHFGRAEYILDDSNWHTDRILSASTSIRPLGNARLPHQAPHPDQQPERPNDHGETLGKRHERQIRTLVGSYPELQSAAHLLSPYIRISELVEDSVWRYDPAKGSLVAFANIRSESRHRTIPIAALPSGETGCVLRIVRAQSQRRGWDEDKSSWLEVTTLRGEETTWCSGNDGPIQQVCFAQFVERGDVFLAVRLISKTLIFRPSHGKVSIETGAGSSITPNLLYSVETRETGGNSHADVAFNPWYAQQVAFVDIAGNWKVLEFKTRKMEQVIKVWGASMRREPAAEHAPLHDGWARVAWISNVATVAVCTRERLTLFSIAADDPATPQDIEIDRSGTVSWTLDFLVLHERPDHMILLTSTHILIYQVFGQPFGGVIASLKMKIRHFRNPENLSMRLTAMVEKDNVILLLHCSASDLVSSYYLQLSGANARLIGDPTELALRMPLRQEGKAIPIVDLHIQPVKRAYKSTSSGSSHGRSRIDSNIRFYSLTIYRSDASVAENLLFGIPSAGAQTQQTLEPPSWGAKMNTTSSMLFGEDFIDAFDELSFDEDHKQRTVPIPRRVRRPKRPTRPNDRLLNLEMVTNDLFTPVNAITAIEDVSKRIKSALMSTDPGELLPMRTLSSLASNEISVGDIQQTSKILEEALHVEADEIENETDDPLELPVRTTLCTIAVSEVTGLVHELSAHDLTSIYNQVVSTWISPLTVRVSGWVRLAKVALARSVATDLVLASRLLQTESVETRQMQQSQTESHPSMRLLDIPFRRSAAVSQQFPSSSFSFADSQPSALPTPSPSATPSVTTTSSHASSFAAPQLDRLSKYISISRPTPFILPRTMNKILSHWETGARPSDYDWLSTSRHVSHQDDDADEELTEKERKRLQRRAERHIRRQHKEAEASQAQQLASSQAPEVVSASQLSAFKVDSQPIGMAGSSQSQSQGPNLRAAVASQVLPGRFGGRPPRKKRKQGF